MGFDGLVTGAAARQLDEVLSGGKIDKIYQPEGDEILFHIHKGREKFKLYISSNSSHPRLHLVNVAGENPQNPSAFCMLLRKHLGGGRIISVRQRESERIVEMQIETVNEMGYSVRKRLIVEIMGKHSNISVLDDETDRIIDSIKRISGDVNRYRQLLPGLTYVYPPSGDKKCFYTLSSDELNDVLLSPSKEGCPVRSLSRLLVDGVQGVSPAIAEEILARASQGAAVDPEFLSGADIYPVIYKMAQGILNGEITPCAYLDKEGIPLDFHIFSLSQLEGVCEKIEFQDVCSAAAWYFSHKASSNRIKQKSKDLERAVSAGLDKLYLKKQRLSEDLLKAEKADTYRLYGELLTAGIHKVVPGAKSVVLDNYYDGSTLEVPLDPKHSAGKNAQMYYKKYGKAKTALREKKIQLTDNEKDIAYLESVLTFVENAQTIDEIEALRSELTEGGFLRKRKNNYKPAKNKPEPYKYHTSDGFRVSVGRNNKENDLLTTKLAGKKDIWFHTKDIPGSHVILFTDDKEPTETAIFEAASLAAWYSKGRSSENVPVDYTRVRYVKKPAGAKPGMVIFTDNKTVYVKPGEPKAQEGGLKND